MTSAPALLSQLDEEERYRRFDQLQERMTGVWAAMRAGHEDEVVVVVPSLSLEAIATTSASTSSGTAIQAMEERFLFLLVLLRQPQLRMVYVTSMPIAPEIVEYYLALLPGIIPSHARARLALVSLNDASPRSLSEKLLARPRQLRRIAALVPNRARAHLVFYNTTARERDIALSLGIPMYGADPRLADLGSKTGCRRLFAQLGVPHPLGADDLHGLDDLAEAVAGMRAKRPSMSSVIVKLNNGVSGQGNAVVPLDGLPTPGHPDEPAAAARPAAPPGAGVAHVVGRGLPRRLRRGRWHRRGAHPRRGVAQSERATPGRPRRPGRAAVDPRPDARRRERAELPRLRVPSLGGVRRTDRRLRNARREPTGGAGRPRPVRGRFRGRPVARGRVGAVRDRAEPPQGRHDPSVPHPAVPHRRSLRPRPGGVLDSQRGPQASRRH